MMNLIFLLILACSFSVSAQVEFLDTQTTASTSFQIPLRVGMDGTIYFMKTTGEMMLGPALGAAYLNKITQYNTPMRISDVPELINPVGRSQSWMEIRKRRYDGGLGISMIIGKFSNGGLIPFKGAMQTIIKMKDNREDPSITDMRIPENLKALESWKIGDQASYQMYGGVEAMLAFGVSIINLARTSVAFQNQFIVELRKVSDKNVIFSIAEEKLTRSESSVGPLVSKVSLAMFRGNRTNFEFALDLTNPEHHRLYEQGLKGKINELQMALDNREQKLKWLGKNKSFYVGIPLVIGLQKSNGNYHTVTNGEDADMDIKTRLSSGILATTGDHNRLVYRTKDAVILLWNSQMTKAKDNMMDKYFFNFGRWIGLRGFEHATPKGMYGTVLTQIGVTFTKDELMSLKQFDMSLMEFHLEKRCSLMRMKCAVDSKRKSIIKNLNQIISQPWDTMSFDLGKLLMENPALIHSTLKLLSLKKEIYVKFLNDNYQSVEGMVGVDL